MVWAYYGLLVGLYMRAPLQRRAREWTTSASSLSSRFPLSGQEVPWWALALAMSAAALSWAAALSLPDSRLHVTFLDVGQGDAAFIVTPGGWQVLVDGGPSPLDAVRHLGERMPFRDRTIDLVVLTHPHSDHVNGLVEVLRRYDVARILERRADYENPAYLAWHRAVAAEGAEVIQAESGQLIAVDDGVFIQVVSPRARLLRGTASDANNASVVLRLVYGDVSFLLTGDMFSEAEGVLVGQNAPVDSDVLKVAHHGSHSSSSEEFLQAVSPAVAVISVGEDNRFDHPHPQTLEALRRRVPKEMLLLTSHSGTIEFATDGRRLKVKTER